LKGTAVRNANLDEAEEQEAQRDDVTEALEPIMPKLEEQEQRIAELESDPVTVGAVDEGTLFKIVSGEELTPDERRAVFEQLI